MERLRKGISELQDERGGGEIFGRACENERGIREGFFLRLLTKRFPRGTTKRKVLFRQ